MKTPTLLLLLLMPALLLARARQNSGHAFSLHAWMEDYRALKKHIEIGYANLEWMIQARRIDLSTLDSKTRQAISRATSDAEAKRALESFLAAFGDGHLNLRERVSSSPVDPSLGRNTSGADACQSMGFTPLEYDFSLPLTKARGFQIISASKGAFTLGVLSLDDGRSYGVLRIPFFFLRRWRWVANGNGRRFAAL